MSQPDQSAPVAAATQALFARVSRKAELIIPLNAQALDPQASGPVLYCVHSITGAGGMDYLALANHLEGAAKMFGVQAPLSRMQDPEFGARLDQLAEVYANAILDGQGGDPIILAGWSAGASIALELAHRLRARGRDVALLAAIDGAPEVSAPRPLSYWLQVARNLPAWFAHCRATYKGFPLTILLGLAGACGRRFGRMISGHAPEMPPRLEHYFSGTLERYPIAQRKFMARLYDAIVAYRPQIWDGPVVVYEARIGRLMLPQYLARWRRCAPQVERALVPGDHNSMMRDPSVAELARDLQRRIAQIQDGRSRPAAPASPS